MGNSITGFRGASFTARDWKLEVWLHLLAREVDKLPNPPEWLVEARDYWEEQATLSVNGCIDPSLDEYLTDDERVAVVRHIAQHVFSSLVHCGERVPREFLHDLCQPTSSLEWPRDVETELFLQYGRALLKLLGAG